MKFASKADLHHEDFLVYHYGGDVMTDRGAANLSGVQLLRGLAACLVLVHHVLEESQPLLVV